MAPPARVLGPFAAILTSAASSFCGIGLPLSEGRAAEKAALALIHATAATAAFLLVPAACRGGTGFVFMPALIAIAAGTVLTAPLWEAMFRKQSQRRLRPIVVLAATAALLAAPIDAPGEGKAALAALAPGLCPASPAQAIALGGLYRDPLSALVQRFGPRRGLAALIARRARPSVFSRRSPGDSGRSPKPIHLGLDHGD